MVVRACRLLEQATGPLFLSLLTSYHRDRESVPLYVA